jgi:hypothetical protein
MAAVASEMIWDCGTWHWVRMLPEIDKSTDDMSPEKAAKSLERIKWPDIDRKLSDNGREVINKKDILTSDGI